MNVLQWMAAASRRSLTLTKPGTSRVVTVTRSGRGWAVTTHDRSVRKDQVSLEDMFERMAFQGWREASS